LLAAKPAGRKVRARPRDEVIKDQSGRTLMRIRYKRDSIALLLPLERVSSGVLDKIRLTVLRILQSENLHVVGVSSTVDNERSGAISHVVPERRRAVGSGGGVYTAATASMLVSAKSRATS